MVKKLVLGGIAAGMVVAFLFGRDAMSYISTLLHNVHTTVKESVPLDFEIDRARQMVADLVPEIRKNMLVIAKEEVEVERLSEQVKEAEDRQGKDRADLGRLSSDVASGKQVFTYGNRSVRDR